MLFATTLLTIRTPLRAPPVRMQLNNMIRTLMGGGGGNGGGGGTVSAERLEDAAPSWEALAAKLDTASTDDERAFRQDLESGRAARACSLASQRLFDLPDGEAPRLTLFRDTAAWCPYCEKVWLVLEEKRVPYEVKKVNMNCYGDKPAWFWAIQPSGGIPVAKLDGQARPLHFPDTPQSPPKIPLPKLDGQARPLHFPDTPQSPPKIPAPLAHNSKRTPRTGR